MPIPNKQSATPRFFLSDVTTFPVAFEEQEGGAVLIRGLPLVNPGKYKGQDFSANVLRQMADNFPVIRDRDGFLPVLSPRHYADPDESLGDFAAVYIDEDTETLLGDVLGSADTAAKVQSGKYKYLSTETDFEYDLQAEDQKDIGAALVGAAFVTYPASRGMKIDVVLNAQAFPQLFEPDKEQLRENPDEGGGNMPTLRERALALFGKVAQGEEVAEDEVEALVGEIPEADEDEPGEEENVVDLDVDQLNRQITQIEKASSEKDARITTLEQARRRDQCDAVIDGLVREHHLPPAQRQAAYMLLERLSTDAQSIIMLGKDAEGKETTQEQSAAELLQAVIKGMGLSAIVSTTLLSVSAEPSVFDQDTDAAADEEAVAAAAAGVAAHPEFSADSDDNTE